MKRFIVCSFSAGAFCMTGVVSAQNISIVRLPDAHVIVHVIDQSGKRLADTAVGIAGTISPNPKSEAFKKTRTDPSGAS